MNVKRFVNGHVVKTIDTTPATNKAAAPAATSQPEPPVSLFDPAAPPDARQLEGRSAEEVLTGGMAGNYTIAALKLVPGLGNVLNLLNAVSDIRERLQYGIDTPSDVLTVQTLKTAAHLAGIIWPTVGAAADILQGTANGFTLIEDEQYRGRNMSPTATHNSMMNALVEAARDGGE